MEGGGNALEIIAVFALLVGIGTFLFTLYDVGALTGYVAGDVNLTVESQTEINFSVSVLNWSSGQVYAGLAEANLSTVDGLVAGGNWTNVSNGLRLVNVGNSNLTLTVVAGKSNATFLGGTNPIYEWNWSNVDNFACNFTTNITNNTFENVNYSGGITVCSPFNYGETEDEIRIDVYLRVPSNSNKGALGDQITVTATAI